MPRQVEVFVLCVGALTTCAVVYGQPQLPWFWETLPGFFGFVGYILLNIGSDLEPAMRRLGCFLYTAALPALGYTCQLVSRMPNWNNATMESRAFSLMFGTLGVVCLLVVCIMLLRPDKVRPPPTCTTEG